MFARTAAHPLDLAVAPLRKSLLELDPEARVMVDPLLREFTVKSRLDESQVLAMANRLGLHLDALFSAVRIRQRGSECCGGCSG